MKAVLGINLYKGIEIPMMYEKPFKPDLPRTVDEVANILIADLPPKEMVTLSSMDEHEFLRLYDSVAQYVLDEFKIWTGNEDLLESCMARPAFCQFCPKPSARARKFV